MKRERAKPHNKQKENALRSGYGVIRYSLVSEYIPGSFIVMQMDRWSELDNAEALRVPHLSWPIPKRSIEPQWPK